jgi:hypothetical protein
VEQRDERLADLVERQSRRIAELESRVGKLEDRLSTGALAPTPRVAERTTGPSAAARAPAPANPWLVGVPALVGRTIMVMGGAFFLRALTDNGTLPQGPGVAVGLAYALVWLLLADRSARSGRAPDATAHGLATTLIAFPLVWETTTSFKVLTPSVSALALTFIAGASLGIAWLRRLGLLAWITTLAATMTGVALLFATHSLPLFSGPLFALAAASLATSFHREWYGLRWPAAIALDLLVVLSMYLMGKPNYEWLDSHELGTVQLLMTAGYLGIIGVRTVVMGHPVREFGVVQSLVVLAVGFEGARRVIGPEHTWTVAFGPIALALAAACYAAAFLRFERDYAQRASWTWYITLGTILTIYGALLLISGPAVGLWCAILVVVAAYIGRRDDRSAVRWNMMAAAAATAFGVGIVTTAYLAFLGADPQRWLAVTPALWGTSALCLGAWVLSRWTRPAGDTARDRTLPGITLLIVGALGAGSGLVTVLAPPAASVGTDAADPGALAVLRTAVVCTSSLIFAALSRIRRHPELVWAAYGALAIAAFRMLADDLPHGRPMTMFLSFIVFGGAMIIAPRLVPESVEGHRKKETA